MTQADEIYNLIRARWNPGDRFNTSEVRRLCRETGITPIDSNVQHYMQHMERRGIVYYYFREDKRMRGEYRRLAVADEKAAAENPVLRSALRFMTNLPERDPLREVTAQRVRRLVEQPMQSQVITDINEIETRTVSKTERLAEIFTRVGQGDFRQRLISYWGGCSFSGCNLVAILRASHIKPWRCSSATERLDTDNGFLLSPSLDALFDKGLITVENDGRIVSSSALRLYSLGGLSIPEKVRKGLTDGHKRHLNFHRQSIFIP